MEIRVANDTLSYLTFGLNNELFAIDASYVLEIMEVPAITKVPNASRYLHGVINFRGEIVPVIHMHERFDMQPDADMLSMIVIVNIAFNDVKMHLGLMVNQVNSVNEFGLKNIKNIPDMGIHFNSEYVSGMIEIDGNFNMILNLERVLLPAELSNA